jgi:TP901 family phage tail tape measure protein
VAGRREFELLFRLQATLGGNFNRSFSNALNTTRQLQNTLSSLDSNRRNVENARQRAQALTNNINRLAELREEHERLQQEMSQTENPSEALQRRFERNARQIEQTTARIEQQQAQLEALGAELQEAGIDINNLSQENERLAESYNRVRRSQEQLARIAEAQRINDEAIGRTRSQLVGTLGAVSAVGAAIYAGPVRDSIEFQESMAKVGTIADESIVPLTKMQREILQLSSTVGVNANLVAEDVYNAISAGQSTENAVGFVETATKLARGGFAETGQALDVLTTIINAYGLESEDAAKISDMLIQTQNKGKVTVAELSSNMGKIIPTAKASNVELEQVCAGYAIMTSKGIAAAETTTYMNSMFNELAKTGSKADNALKQMAGAGFNELMAQGKSVAEVLDILEQSAKQSGLNLADMFGSAEAGKAALTIMADGVDGFNESVAGMLGSTGAAEAAFAKMSNTAQDKINKSKEALHNLSIVLGDTFLPYVTTAAEKLTVLITKFSDWAMANPGLMNTIVKVAGGLAAFRIGTLGAKLGFLQLKGVVLDVVAAFASFRALGGVQGILGSVGGFSGLVKGIGGSLLPIAGVAAAVAVAIKLISGNLEEVRGFVERVFGSAGLAVFDKVVSVFQNIGNAIKGIFGDENISNAENFLQNAFGDAGISIFNALVGVMQRLKSILPAIIDQLTKGAAAVLPVVVGLVKQFVAVVGVVLANVLPMLINAVGQILPLVEALINMVLPALIQLIQDLMPVISAVIESVLPVIIQLLQVLLPIIQQIVQAVLPVFIQLLQSLASVVRFVAELFGNVLGVVLKSVAEIISGVMQAFQGLIDFITGVFTGNWAKAWEGVKNIFAGIVGSLAGIFKAPINLIISGINTFLSGLNKIKIPDWVPGVGGKGFNISLLPMLAKGSNYAPDTFIAGEAGAELITGARGRKVFTAAQTGDIFRNLGLLSAAMAGGISMPVPQSYLTNGGLLATAPTLELPETRTTTITLRSNPVFYINNGDSEEIRQALNEYQQDTLNKVDEMWRKTKDDERRMTL